MGERFNGIEEVVGSIPISSTKNKKIDYNLNLSPRYTLLTSLLFNNLSDDPDAKQMKEQITQSAAMMGLPKCADINNVFNDMSKAVSLMKDQIDNI